MRKLLTLLLVFSVAQCLLAHDYVKTITLSYPASELSIVTVDSLTSVSAPSKVYWHDTDSAMPMLPKMAANVLLEPNVEVIDVDFRAANPVFWRHVTMEGCKLPVPTDSDYNIPAYPATNSVSPNVNYLGDSEVRGHRIGTFEVFPFGYDVSTGLLWICQDIIMTVTLRANQGHSPLPPLSQMTWQCDTARQWLRDMVCNAYDVDTLDSNVNLDIVPASKRYEYLIITNNALKPEFQRLSDWKNIKGVRTKILTTEEIYQDYPDTTPQRQIKRAIIAMRDSTRGALRYVLLGGDETVVPVQYCRVKCLSLKDDGKDTLYIADTPADIYYASLKELEWDNDGNGYAGEVEDSVSLASDLDVTRMPVSNLANASVQINRILYYEQKANLQPWTNKILLVGCKISYMLHDPSDGQLVSDSHLYSNKMYNDYIQGKWSGQAVRFYDTGTNFPENASYDVTADHLREQLSNGYTFVHVDTHGGPQSWKTEFVPNFITSDATLVSNSSNSILLTTACHTSKFDVSSQCLAEAFLNNPQSGVLAYFGDAHYGWNMSSDYNGEIMASIFKFKSHLGNALSLAKNKLLNKAKKNNAPRWITMSLLGFGDAEMPVFVQRPQIFQNLTFHINSGSLIVNEHIDSCRTCVMSMDDMGQTYYNVKKNVTSVWNQFSGLDRTRPYSVCVTRDGYIPYVAQLQQSFLMQDETLNPDDELHVIADHVSLGYHVTDDKPQGQVIISGNMTIQCPNGILIDRGTTIENGAKFQVLCYN